MRFDPQDFITLLPVRPRSIARLILATVVLGLLAGVLLGWGMYLAGMDPVHP